MNPEFSHPLVLERVPRGGLRLRLAADAAARERLAKRFGLLSLGRLEAELALRPVEGGRVAVTGRLSAAVEQPCVVTLEPVAQEVEEAVEWLLLPDGIEPTEDLDSEGPDEIESEAGVADLGEALAQQLSLALDPFPRAPGAELPEAYRGEDTGPFAALARLRKDG
ncbi:MAG: DUF177 domain-containing protein [Acetobacteraceae bacterium]|nr:DUF177 domain-containing protein [Acetobacteraceae bacterium]